MLLTLPFFTTGDFGITGVVVDGLLAVVFLEGVVVLDAVDFLAVEVLFFTAFFM